MTATVTPTVTPPMGAPANTSGAPTPAPLTEDAFLADRQKFWASFTGLVTTAVIVVVVLLIGMAIFLV